MKGLGSAFTRAFQSFHGTPPTIVRKVKIAKSFQPISLELKILGGSVMSEAGTIVHIKELKDVKVVSFTANCEMGGYEIDFEGRTFLEEHIFPEQWFTTDKPEHFSAQFNFGYQ